VTQTTTAKTKRKGKGKKGDEQDKRKIVEKGRKDREAKGKHEEQSKQEWK
jgi:hypothetical protein